VGKPEGKRSLGKQTLRLSKCRVRTVKPKKQLVLKDSDEGTSHSVRSLVFGTDHDVPNVQRQTEL
jgi:hypothetical protein